MIIMGNSYGEYDDFGEEFSQNTIINQTKQIKQKKSSGPYIHNFWKETKRLAEEWNADNEGMELIEYIEHYAPENICDDINFEIIYPENIKVDAVKSKLLEHLSKKETI